MKTPPSSDTMKGYAIVNRYCKGIQAGIQASHAIVDYFAIPGENDVAREWAEHYKTLCLLEASDTTHLQTISDLLNGHGVTHSVFKEEGLNYSCTALFFIADKRMCSVMAEIKRWQAGEIKGRNGKILPKGDFIDALYDYYTEAEIQVAQIILKLRSHPG